MNSTKVINQLKKKYPNKLIIENKVGSKVTEIICEAEPSQKHKSWSIAICVIDSIKPHFHKDSIETYKILKGNLELFIDGKLILLKKDDEYVIKPFQMHWAKGNETWLECTSRPGWQLEDHLFESPKTILVTGASGYVGAKIYQDLKLTNNKVIGTYFGTKQFNDLIKVNLTNKKEVEKIFATYKPDIVVHAAANGNGKWCEENPEKAYDINVNSTKYVVENSKKLNSKVIHISSFACFNPINVHGRTKKEAEKIVEKLDNYVILRSSLVIGLSPNTENDRPFNRIIKNITDKSTAIYDSSWKFNVTYLQHLSEVIQILINNNEINKTMIPIVARGKTSRYKIAKDILPNFGFKVVKDNLNMKLIEPQINWNLYKKLGLPAYNYQDAIGKINKEILHFIDKK